MPTARSPLRAAWWPRSASSRFLPAPSSRRKAPTATSRRRRDGSAGEGCPGPSGRNRSANEDVVQGSLDLIVMQRQAEMMQRALTVFHTDFNKFATEDLPKV